MHRSLIERLICPYCLGRFSVTHSAEVVSDTINWALLRCRCFEFPIIDGVLLLGLTKGYGGSEEVLAPYVPLQVAAVEYLRAGDLPELRHWIEKHVPLLHRLISPRPISYLDFSKELNTRLWPQVEKDLFSLSAYGVLGRRGALRRSPRLVNTLATTSIGYAVMRVRRRLFPHVWSTFYLNRFVSNELARLRDRLHVFPVAGPVLSLCCGHGPFEFLLSCRSPNVPVVSMDGQLLNLFVVKRFIAPNSDFICHDVQFDLPFQNKFFSEVFSSTCLFEVPAQAHLVREAIRVTCDSGWTMFDTVTPDEQSRIVPTRYYRICQNHFSSLEDYVQLMAERAGERELRFAPATSSAPSWNNDITNLKGAESASFVFNTSPIDLNEAGPPTFSLAERSHLAVNPWYKVQRMDTMIVGRLRWSETARIKLGGASISKLPSAISIDQRRLENDMYLSDLYQKGIIVLLPKEFGGEAVNRLGL